MAPNGKLPFNTDGGGLCNNHPSNRGGVTKVIEAVRQLRGEAHRPSQVPDCDIALAHGTGGSIGSRMGSSTLILGQGGRMSTSELPDPAPVDLHRDRGVLGRDRRRPPAAAPLRRLRRVHLVPAAVLPVCGSTSTSWTEASGRGTVYTFTVVHRSGVPGYRDALPYVIAYVELEEGPRVMTNIVDIEPDQVRSEMPVTVVFHDTGQGNALFRFQPAASSQ